MSSLLRTASTNNIKQILKVSTQPLTNYDRMPKNYLIDQNNEKKECTAIADYKFGDFKEAFCYLNLIAQACNQFDYYPQIFNVYNRVTVKLYSSSSDKSSQKFLTEKELYVSHLINEIVNQKFEDAHQKTLQKMKQLL